jgi:hypothetical protein
MASWLPPVKPISKQFNSAYLGSLALGFDPASTIELLSRQTVINKSRRPAAKTLNSCDDERLNPTATGLGTPTLLHDHCIILA